MSTDYTSDFIKAYMEQYDGLLEEEDKMGAASATDQELVNTTVWGTYNFQQRYDLLQRLLDSVTDEFVAYGLIPGAKKIRTTPSIGPLYERFTDMLSAYRSRKRDKQQREQR
jgi:hypothetical protein